MRIFTGVLILIMSLTANAAAGVWSDSCQITQNKTICTLWPATLAQFSRGVVSKDDQQLQADFSSVDYSLASSAAVVLQSPGLSVTELKTLKSALGQFVDHLGARQHAGIYATSGYGSTLKTLAPIGTSSSQLKNAIQAFAPQSVSGSVRDALTDLSSILGGSPAERRTIFWVTTGYSLSEADQTAIKEKLLQEEKGIRLVVVYLQRSELDQNVETLFPVLLSDEQNILVPAYASSWDSIFTELGKYNLTSTKITIDSAQLCGENHLTLSARFDQKVFTHQESYNYPTCSNTQPTQAPTEPQEQSGQSDQPDATPSPNQQPDESSPENPSPTPSEPEGQSEQGSQPGETPPTTEPTEQGDPQPGQPEEPVEPLPLEFEQPVYNFEIDHQFDVHSLLSSFSLQPPVPNGVIYNIESGNEAGLFALTDSGELTLTDSGADMVTNHYDELSQSYHLRVSAAAADRSGLAVVTISVSPEPIWANTFLMVALAFGIVVLIICLYILLRSRRKTIPFASLTEYSIEGYKHHPLLKSATKIGRGDDNDIVLDDDTVSAFHAVLKRSRDASLTIVDLGSTNGTRVNDVLVTQQVVKSGDMLEFGEYKLRLEDRF